MQGFIQGKNIHVRWFSGSRAFAANAEAVAVAFFLASSSSKFFAKSRTSGLQVVFTTPSTNLFLPSGSLASASESSAFNILMTAGVDSVMFDPRPS